MEQRLINLFWRNVSKSDGCWEWRGYIGQEGYGQFRAGSSRRNARRYLAHRLAFELTNGQIPDGLYACHRCDNRRCVNPLHIFIGTAKDNARDRESKGRSNPLQGKYERNPHNVFSKIDVETVKEIRDLYRDCKKISQLAIAKKFGISQQAVSCIIRKQTWTDEFIAKASI